jgi:hypothetical protein
VSQVKQVVGEVVKTNVIQLRVNRRSNIERRQGQLHAARVNYIEGLPEQDRPIAVMMVELRANGTLSTLYEGIEPEFVRPMINASKAMASELLSHCGTSPPSNLI